jgi:hypothetical protein
MMLPTHVIAGMVLALPVFVGVPEFAGVALLAGAVGGALPDLDMYVGHRKTLHYPFYYTGLAGLAALLALAVPTWATVGVAVATAAAAVHCLADVVGSGLELRPWEATSDRAVYDHVRGTWIPPRRWIRYDGAPEDLLLSVALAAPLFAVLDRPFSMAVGAALAVAVLYTGVRRLLPRLAVVLVSRLPAAIRTRLPARYVDGRPG